jgi:NAD(P)H-nitrite reductase large subunit
MVCRCEEILDGEIAAALASGARTVDDVKRRTRAGMGVCQGVFCMPVIAALVAQATGERIEETAPMMARPPVRPIALEALAGASEGMTARGAGREQDSEG